MSSKSDKSDSKDGDKKSDSEAKASPVAVESLPSPTVETVKPASIKYGQISISKDDYGSEVAPVYDGLFYLGFDPIGMRARIYEAGLDDIQISKLVMAYLQLGNNIDSKSNKRKNQESVKVVKTLFSRIGGLRKAVNPTDVTLSRIGIAFAPAVFEYRRIFNNAGKLIVRVQSSTKPAQADPALLMMAKVPEDMDFHYKFAVILWKAANKGKSADVDEIHSNVDGWLEVARSGIIADHLTNKLLSTSVKKKQEVKRIMVAYRTEWMSNKR